MKYQTFKEIVEAHKKIMKEQNKHHKERAEDTIKYNSMLILIKQKNTQESSIMFCDEIKYLHDKGKYDGITIFDHHLFFYREGILIYKVYLKNKAKDKIFRSAKAAIEATGMRLVIPISETIKRVKR